MKLCIVNQKMINYRFICIKFFKSRTETALKIYKTSTKQIVEQILRIYLISEIKAFLVSRSKTIVKFSFKF